MTNSCLVVDRPVTLRAATAAEDVIPGNIQMNDVKAAFAAVNVQGTRQYYECGDPPTQLTGVPESHFKGVAAFGDKLLFAHTDLDPIFPATNGRYLIGDVVAAGEQGTIDVDEYTQHAGWCHPCGMQACGSFMAMGIQQSASGSGAQVSQIQVFDIRNANSDQPIVLLGAIDRPHDGINGVAMTKEAGANGRYVVAGVNGNILTVYRSVHSSLLAPGGARFVEVFQDTNFPDSGAGLALITQADGDLFLVSMNANDDGSNSLIGLYRLDCKILPPYCFPVAQKAMSVPGMSESVTLIQDYVATLPVIGPLLSGLLAPLDKLLNSSFRWGKGLAVTSADTLKIYATDRNVLPVSKIAAIGSVKDFSVVAWTNAPLA